MPFKKKYSSLPELLIIPGSLYLQKKDFALLTQSNWTELNKYREFLGDRYAFFRIYNWFENDWFYRSSAYAKHPAVLIQFPEFCEIIQFTAYKDGAFSSAALKKNDDGFEIALDFFPYQLNKKLNSHLGDWQETIDINFSDEININILTKKKWFDYFIEKFNNSEFNSELDLISLQNSEKLAGEFCNKIFDSRNQLHCEFIRSDASVFDLNRDLYCLPTYQFSRIFFLSSAAETSELNFYENSLKRLLDLTYINAAEINAGFTHNTIGIDDYGFVFAHTQFNTGLAGYPGGVASDLIYILQFYLRVVKKSADSEKAARCFLPSDVFDKCRNMINWLEYVQNDDFTFPYTIPTVSTKEELFYKCSSSNKTITAGGAGAAALAFLLWYEITGKKKYLENSEQILRAVLPSTDILIFLDFYAMQVMQKMTAFPHIILLNVLLNLRNMTLIFQNIINHCLHIFINGNLICLRI